MVLTLAKQNPIPLRITARSVPADKPMPQSGIPSLINITTDTMRHRPKLLSVLLCNPRSLNNKFDELSVVLNKQITDIAAITETWFSPDHLTMEEGTQGV